MWKTFYVKLDFSILEFPLEKLFLKNSANSEHPSYNNRRDIFLIILWPEDWVVKGETDLSFEFLDFRREFFRLLYIMPLGLPFTVQDLQQVQMLLLQLLLLLQHFAVARMGKYIKISLFVQFSSPFGF